ncbi:unnamed protein product [Ixodes pacificus]
MYEERSRFSKTGVNMEQSACSGFLKLSADKCASVSTKEPFVVEVTPRYQQPQSVDVPGVETTSAFTGDKPNPPGGGEGGIVIALERPVGSDQMSTLCTKNVFHTVFGKAEEIVQNLTCSRLGTF